MKQKIRHSRIFFFISLGVLLVALTQKTYCTPDCGSHGSGFVAFLFGTLGIFVGGAYITWFANPFLILSWLFIGKRPWVSLVLSSFSLAIAFSFLTYDEIMIKEAGHYGKIVGYALGYWLWITSIAIMLLGSLFCLLRKT